ncbi:MAG: formate transporter [Gammaproteobacteria bacterium]|jgi:formate transporter
MRSEGLDHENVSIDAYAPAKIASLVDAVGIKKANMPFLPLFTLGLLAGMFIAFGAMFYTVVITGSSLGFGPTRLLGGLVFSLGLILVVIAGAELFTGNNLIIIAWAQRNISSSQLLRNWIIVYFANFIGSILMAFFVHFSGMLELADGAVRATAFGIVNHKAKLDFVQAFSSGVLCNALVCLAVWLSLAAHTVSGKILAIIFPISAFVALGFEHSVANMYFFGLFIFQPDSSLGLADMMQNLVPVTLGNIVGGSGLVALIYWICYLRPTK